jgi:hypothetical protein
MRYRLSSLIMVLALLVCPVVCFSEGLAHEDNHSSPADGGEHRSCVEHPCICAGATIPTTDHAIGAAVAPPIAVLPVESFTDGVSLKAGAYAATSMLIPDPPGSRRILPLLI